jgi:hypothetical protein
VTEGLTDEQTQRQMEGQMDKKREIRVRRIERKANIFVGQSNLLTESYFLLYNIELKLILLKNRHK